MYRNFYYGKDKVRKDLYKYPFYIIIVAYFDIMNEYSCKKLLL